MAWNEWNTKMKMKWPVRWAGEDDAGGYQNRHNGSQQRPSDIEALATATLNMFWECRWIQPSCTFLSGIESGKGAECIHTGQCAGMNGLGTLVVETLWDITATTVYTCFGKYGNSGTHRGRGSEMAVPPSQTKYHSARSLGTVCLCLCLCL